MSITRRHFLKTAGAIALGFTGLQKMLALNDFESVLSSGTSLASQKIKLGFGPLIKDPKGILDLPKGFSYKIISKHGVLMNDGLIVPALADGMAAFPGENGRTILIRNHEVNSDSKNSFGAFGKNIELLKKIDKSKLYDSAALGGATTIVFNTKTQKVEKQFMSLAGTLRNCAGGPTPWNSWISCEETMEKAEGKLSNDHGYCFEVPATSEIKLVEPIPLTAMGRFRHEAIAVEPKSGIVYLTEDMNDSLIYRFIPNKKAKLNEGGKLQALKVIEHASIDTRNWEENIVKVGERLVASWIDLDDVKSPNDDLRYRGFSNGAARFARGEGMWFGNGSVYFVCTSGGKAKKGQIWKYTPSVHEGTKEELTQPGTLELFIEPDNSNILDMADNLTVSPWGDLIVCEDGPPENYLLGITPEGDIYKFGRNAFGTAEFAGAAFSPDGSTLFFNMQQAGFTFAVTGPWKA